MSPISRTILKIGSFGVVMVLLTVALFAIFGQYRTGATNGYSAVFTDASRLKSGDTVRVAGIRVFLYIVRDLFFGKHLLQRFSSTGKLLILGTETANNWASALKRSINILRHHSVVHG